MSLNEKAKRYGVEGLDPFPGLNRKKRREYLKYAIKKTKERLKKETTNEQN